MKNQENAEDLKPHSKDYQIFSLTQKDGLKGLTFETRSVFSDPQNRLWWGASEALTTLDLDQFKLPTEAPKNVELSHIEINGTFVDYRRLKD